MALYDEQGHPLDSDATPSWYTPSKGQGPQDNNGWTPPVDLPGIYSGGNPNQMGAYDPNFNYGGNGDDGGGHFFRHMLQMMPQYQAGRLLARGGRSLWHALMNHLGNRGDSGNANPSGGYDPHNYGTPGEGGYKFGIGRNLAQMDRYDPNFNYGSGGPQTGPTSFGPFIQDPSAVAASVGHPMESLPGSFDGLGRGSSGSIGWDYFSRMGLNRLMHGGDPSLGFEGFGGINTGTPMLPTNQWGGVGYGGNTQGGSNIGTGSGTGRKQSNV